jgi:hypothetical protein
MYFEDLYVQIASTTMSPPQFIDVHASTLQGADHRISVAA